ncbi:MAG: NUDIX domain-containing protein [Lachnospiraceae bacterium]|nr:NUDIX domain-containing protein [Lachnospiraceae bacterium]
MPEYWDLVDNQGKYIGEHMLRGTEQPQNTWHCVVGIIIQNNIGEILFIKRAHTKKQYPNMWEHIGGCVVSGETPIEAACREVYEEVGISLTEEKLMLVDTFFEKTAYVYTFYIQKEISIDKFLLQENEVSDIKWVEAENILKYPEKNQVSPAAYRRLKRAIFRMKVINEKDAI